MSFLPLTAAAPLAFSHAVQYFAEEPMVEVEVAATDPVGVLLGEARPTSVMVDSGTDYTILDERLILVLGIDLSQCVPAPMKGIGEAVVPGVAYDYVRIGICGVSVLATVVFQAKPQPQLLGRQGVFEQINFAFVHSQRRMLAAA